MSKTLKRPMFRMGGDTNSGIMSGFEREKFSLGTSQGQSVPGGYNDIMDFAVPRRVMFADASSSMDFQPQADLITAAKQSGSTTTPAATPAMSMQEKFGQMVGSVPDECQRGFGL